MGAMKDVVATVTAAWGGGGTSGRIVLLAALDVRNAFNSLRWVDVIGDLEQRFHAPAYLMRMIRSYLSDRELLYHTSGGPKRRIVTSGAAQGSILGPDLWNASYDGIFSIDMPDETHLVGFADDIAALIVARDVPEAQRRLNQVMIRTMSWMESRGLKLATEKTELILLTRRHIPLEIDMRVCDSVIKTKKVVNYLGVRFDSRMSFWAQINHAVEKASRASWSLSRLMANVGGPTESKRKLLMSTVNAVLLYGSEVWAHTLNVKQKSKAMLKVQRTAALRVASAYRTVSAAAVLVISSVIPIDLMAMERRHVWLSRQADHDDTGATEGDIGRRHTMQQWQARWDAETYGRWTKRLIPDVSEWSGRKFGEVNYYLTQLLSGHGYFCEFLHRMGKREQPCCIYGDSDVDNAEHTFFACSRWSAERQLLEVQTGSAWRPESVVLVLLSSEQNWTLVAKHVERVLRTKKRHLDAGTTMG